MVAGWEITGSKLRRLHALAVLDAVVGQLNFRMMLRASISLISV